MIPNQNNIVGGARSREWVIIDPLNKSMKLKFKADRTEEDHVKLGTKESCQIAKENS